MRLAHIFIPEKKRDIYIFFIVFIIFTIIASLGLINTQFDNDVTVLLPVNVETDYEREKIARLTKEFPSDQLLFVGIDKAFTLDKIKTVWQICNEIDQLGVVRSSFHPFNAVYFTKIGDTFTISKMRSSIYPRNQKQLDNFIKDITSNRYLIGSVISYDYEKAGIVIRMNYKAKMREEIKKNFFIKIFEFLFGRDFGPQYIDRTYFCSQIENVLNKYKNEIDFYIAGVPYFEAKSKTYMQRDLLVLLVPAILFMILVLFLNIRTNRGTLLPILIMILSLIWTMGFIGWIRYKLNIVSILLPPIILTIGSSYTLHYLYSYYSFANFYNNSRDIVIHASKHIFPTIFMASLTTAIGFSSFISASIKPIKMFGFFSVLSILFTVSFTFFLLSKIFSLLPVPHQFKLESVKNDIFSKFLAKINLLVYPFRFFWVLLYFVVIITFIFVIQYLRIETNAATYFKEKDLVKKSLFFFQKNFGGTNHYNITLRAIGNKANFFKTREGLLAAKKVQDYFNKNVIIDGEKTIGWFLSPVSLVEDLNYVLTGSYDLPENEKTISRFLSLLTASNDEGIRAIMNKKFSAITFQVRTKTDNEKEKFIMTEQTLFKLEKKIKKDLWDIARDDGRFTVEIWGELLLMARISKYLIKDQVLNIITTVIFVFLASLIFFRSLYLSIFSLVSLSFGVISNFVIMCIFKIALDPATVMIAAISIGVGIDDSIHFLLTYKNKLKNGLPIKDAILESLYLTSRPIVFTSIALILGFIVFFLSSFRPIVYFGALISISMLTCTFATLFILPSFLIVTDRFRLKYKKRNK